MMQFINAFMDKLTERMVIAFTAGLAMGALGVIVQKIFHL